MGINEKITRCYGSSNNTPRGSSYIIGDPDKINTEKVLSAYFHLIGHVMWWQTNYKQCYVYNFAMCT